MLVLKKKKVKGGYLRIVKGRGYVMQYRRDADKKYFTISGPDLKSDRLLEKFKEK